jgi:hypothetical protein
VDTLKKKNLTPKGITLERRDAMADTAFFLTEVYLSQHKKNRKKNVPAAVVHNKYLVQRLARGTPTKGSSIRPDPRRIAIAGAAATGQPLLHRKGRLTAATATCLKVIRALTNGADDLSPRKIFNTYHTKGERK